MTEVETATGSANTAALSAVVAASAGSSAVPAVSPASSSAAPSPASSQATVQTLAAPPVSEASSLVPGSHDKRPLLEVQQLRCGYGKKRTIEIVHGVDFTVDKGEFVCIIGANGCGKTTTLKAIMGLLPIVGGSVHIGGVEITHMKERERARHFAYIPQAHTPPFPFSVADVVMMGRTPYVNKLARVSTRDRVVAYQALELLGIDNLADDAYTKLSGGQQQLVLIARALTQQAEMLIMDEPTAALDFGNQQLVLSRMRMLSRMGKAVIMVTHDPDHALFCSDRVLVMEEGVLLEAGTPEQCITTEILYRIYGANARVMDVELEPGVTKRVCISLQR